MTITCDICKRKVLINWDIETPSCRWDLCDECSTKIEEDVGQLIKDVRKARRK